MNKTRRKVYKLYSKSDPLLPVEDKPILYEKYHVSWANNNGVVGRVKSINEINKTVIMESPKTNVEWKNPVKWSDLRHLRKTQYKLESK